MDVRSIFLLVYKKDFKQNCFCKLLFETQPAMCLKCFLIFAQFQPHVSYRMFLIKNVQ